MMVENNFDSQEFRFELRRQAFHLLLCLTIAILFLYDILITPLFVFIVLIIGFILSWISRKHRIPLVSTFLDYFERKDIANTFPGKGALFLTAGVLLVIKLFPKDIAIASILILGVGDSVSHIIGRYFGKTKNPVMDTKKLLEGTIAGIVFSFIIASMFNLNVVWWHLLIACVAGMFVEAIELEMNKREVDDNIVVPLAAGTVLLLLSIYA